MKIPIYQIDAFTDKQFKGNPAAVCVLKEWIEEETMQNIAKENNLSETAFFVKRKDVYELRWFTPEKEIDLCGHATLATAHVIFEYIDNSTDKVTFDTKSGILEVSKEGNLLTMVFPSREGEGCEVPEELILGLGREPVEVYKSRDYMAVYERIEHIKDMNLNMEELKKLNSFGVIVTTKGRDEDFVSRYFAPKAGVDEDPVTGSAHCTLIPYWSKTLDKKKLVARQMSKRGGILICEDLGEKVKISGKAVTYLEGYIRI